MHVVFSVFCFCLLSLSTFSLLHAAEHGDNRGSASLDADALHSLAVYYRSRFPDPAALSRYVDQVSVDPLGFRKTVREDLLETFELSPEVLSDALLQRYVQAEVVSMYFIKTGRCDMSLQDLKSLCADKQLRSEFRVIPKIMLSYKDPDSFHALSDVFLWRPQLIPVFQRVHHPRYVDVAALYLSYVYRDFVMRKQFSVQTQYLMGIEDWLLALHFQSVDQHVIVESIDLAVKISAQEDLAKVHGLRRTLMICMRDCGRREWQEAYVRSCLQHGVTSQLDGDNPAKK